MCGRIASPARRPTSPRRALGERTGEVVGPEAAAARRTAALVTAVSRRERASATRFRGSGRPAGRRFRLPLGAAAGPRGVFLAVPRAPVRRRLRGQQPSPRAVIAGPICSRSQPRDRCPAWRGSASPRPKRCGDGGVEGAAMMSAEGLEVGRLAPASSADVRTVNKRCAPQFDDLAEPGGSWHDAASETQGGNAGTGVVALAVLALVCAASILLWLRRRRRMRARRPDAAPPGRRRSSPRRPDLPAARAGAGLAPLPGARLRLAATGGRGGGAAVVRPPALLVYAARAALRTARFPPRAGALALEPRAR